MKRAGSAGSNQMGMFTSSPLYERVEAPTSRTSRDGEEMIEVLFNREKGEELSQINDQLTLPEEGRNDYVLEQDHHTQTSSGMSAKRTVRESSIVGHVFSVFHRISESFWEFYQSYFRLPTWLQPSYEKIDLFFQCSKSNSSVETEIFSGIINFFSCLYILAVIPVQMSQAGYDRERSAAVISLLTGLGSIGSGLITNTPLVVAPATAVSIYFVSNIQQYFLSLHNANMAVGYAGIVIVIVGIIGPLGRLISKLIPEPIQIATTVGIGLITTLSGYVDIQLVEHGQYTLLTVGKITDKIAIAFSGLILIAIGVYYHSRFSYFVGMLWGTFIWWTSKDAWPTVIVHIPTIIGNLYTQVNDPEAILLTFDLIFLIILTLFGLAKALCDLAEIKATDTSIPKGRLLMIVIGVVNIISGCLYGPPIILSPECASGIKSGARTGLSAVVCGVFFLLSIFFAPLFNAIPAAATTPVLIMIGMILFQNVNSIDFSSKYGIAAFVCLTLIPFTDSIIAGLAFGYITYIAISLLNGDTKDSVMQFLRFYFPSEEEDDEDANDDTTSLELRKNLSVHLIPTTVTDESDESNPKKLEDETNIHSPKSPHPHQKEQGLGVSVPTEKELYPKITVERARRNTLSLINQITTEVDLPNEIIKPVI